MDDHPKRPRDPAQLAKLVVDIATGQVEDKPEDKSAGKNPHAVALGRLGGQRGGAARKKSLSPEQRRDIARRAAQARWSKSSDG